MHLLCIPDGAAITMDVAASGDRRAFFFCDKPIIARCLPAPVVARRTRLRGDPDYSQVVAGLGLQPNGRLAAFTLPAIDA